MKSLHNTLRNWLLTNDYADIASLIEEIMLEWKVQGNKQRRNWWDVLAGDKNGNSRIISGRKIPVLKAAQLRKGMKVTPNALCRNAKKEVPIPINDNNRWLKKK